MLPTAWEAAGKEKDELLRMGENDKREDWIGRKSQDR